MPHGPRPVPGHPLHHVSSLGRHAHLNEPPWRFGHKDHESSLAGGRHCSEPNHPPPPSLLEPILGKAPPDQVGNDLSHGDEEDVCRNQPASVRRRRNLCDVKGHHEAGSTHPGPDDAPPHDHARDRRGEGLEDRSQYEQNVGKQDDAPASQRVGEDGREGRQEQGKQCRRRRDDGFVDQRQLAARQRRPDRHESRRDDPGIVWGVPVSQLCPFLPCHVPTLPHSRKSQATHIRKEVR